MSLVVDIRKTFRSGRERSFELDVNFTAEFGVTALFGASGSGKTSVLNCIAGLTSPESGTIRLDGKTMFDSQTNVNVRARERGLGYVFQTSALFPTMNVLENVMFSGTVSREAAESLLRRFKVERTLKQRPNQLSGGEKQRVELARTFASNPKALLLDEPFSGLDDTTKFDLLHSVREWTAEKKIPVLYVTHALEEVFILADSVIVLAEGRIAKQGIAREVLAEEKNRLVAALT